MRNARVAALVAACAAASSGCGGKVVHYLDHGAATDTPSSSGETPDPEPSPVGPPSSDAPPPATPPPTPTRAPATPCAVSFAGDVLPTFMGERCTVAACHGGTNPPNLPRIDPSAPMSTWQSLRTFLMSDGRLYVVAGSVDPAASGIHCNLRRECGVGMPLGGTASDADLAIVDAWLACGAPPN